MADTLTKEKRIKAINGVVARFLDSNIEATKRGDAPATLSDAMSVRRFGYDLVGFIPEDSQGRYIEALSDTQKYARDPSAQLAATSAIVREMMQQIEARKDLPDVNITQITDSMYRFGKNLNTTEKREDAIQLEAKNTAALPTIPKVPDGVASVTKSARLKALNVVMAKAISADDMDAERIQEFGKTLLTMAPAGKQRELKRKLDDTNRYDGQPKAEKAAATIAVREIMQSIVDEGDKISPTKILNVQSQMVTMLGSKFTDTAALEAKWVAEITSPSAMPDAPAVPDTATTVDVEARIKALNGIVAKRIDEKLKKGGLSESDLRGLVDDMRSGIPSSERELFNDKIGEAGRYSDPAAQKGATIKAVRETMQSLADNSKTLTAPEIITLQKRLTASTSLFKNKAELDTLLKDAAPNASDYAIPAMPRGATPPKSPAEEINAFNAVMANTLDSNLTSKGLSASQVRNFASDMVFSLKIPSEDKLRYNQMLTATSKLSGDDELKAVTNITREVMQTQMDTGNFNYAQADEMKRTAVRSFFKVFPNKAAMDKALATEFTTPTGKLPAAPTMPGGDWMPKKTITPLETNDKVRVGRAVIDLTATPESGGRDRARPTGKWDSDKKKYVVYYSFKGTVPDGELATGMKKMSAEREAAMRRTLAEVADIGSIEFLDFDDPKNAGPGKPAAPNIMMAEGTFKVKLDKKGNEVIYAGYATPAGMDGQNNLVIRNDTPNSELLPGQAGQAVMMHELLHTLGISHPGAAKDTTVILGREGEAGGKNTEYTKRSTVMSYNAVANSISGIGPYDIAAIQYIYGANENGPTDRKYTLEALAGTSTVYSKGKAVLDFRGPAFTGNVKVDMSSNLLYPISGTLQGKDGPITFDPRIAVGTDYEILMDNTSRIAIDISGKKDAKLRGGRNGDTLTAVGGNNQLTGGMGRDTFVLSTASGDGNVITDFNTTENDQILIRPGASEVRLEYVETGGAAKNEKGTYIKLMKAGSEEPAASVFVKDTRPDAVKAAMVTMISDTSPRPKIVAGPAKDLAIEKRNKEYAAKLEEALGLGKQFGVTPEIVELASGTGAETKPYITYTITPPNPELIKLLGVAINAKLKDTPDAAAVVGSSDAEGTMLAFPIDAMVEGNKDTKLFDRLKTAKLKEALDTIITESKKPKTEKKQRYEEYAKKLTEILGTDIRMTPTEDGLIMDKGDLTTSNALKGMLVPIFKTAGVTEAEALLSVTAEGKLKFDPAVIDKFDAEAGKKGAFLDMLGKDELKKKLQAVIKPEPVKEPPPKKLPPVRRPDPPPIDEPPPPLPPTKPPVPPIEPPPAGAGGFTLPTGARGILDTVGTGTAAGVAIGGIGALIMSLFMGGSEGKGPGFFKSLLMVVAGAVVGGLAGGFINKDGPLFGKDKGNALPDGTPVTKLPMGIAPVPAKDQVVEVEGVDKVLEAVGIPTDPSGRNKFRLLVKTGDVTATSATFTGAYSSDGKRFMTFDKPVVVPVADGKIDYTTVAALTGMRFAEKGRAAGYMKLNDVEGLISAYGTAKLDPKQQELLKGELMLSALGKEGKVTKELAESISNNAVKPDGTLNVEFLKNNKDALGIDQKRAFMFAPDGDNINMAMGTLSPNEKGIQVEQTVVIDVKKITPQLRTGEIQKLMDPLRSAEKTAASGGFDLSMIAARSSVGNVGITYRKAAISQPISAMPRTIGKRGGGDLEISEFNRAVEVINRSDASSVDTGPSLPVIPGMGGAPKPRLESR